MYFTSKDGSQNTFVYQPTLDTSELKKDKHIGYVLSWKSNEVYNSKLKPLYTAFLHNIKLSGYKMGIKFDNDYLAVEQNNYLTKIVNVYIVCDLAPWLKISLKNFSRDQKKVIDRESRLIPRKIKKTIHSLKNPNHINKISYMLPEIWLLNLQ